MNVRKTFPWINEYFNPVEPRTVGIVAEQMLPVYDAVGTSRFEAYSTVKAIGAADATTVALGVSVPNRRIWVCPFFSINSNETTIRYIETALVDQAGLVWPIHQGGLSGGVGDYVLTMPRGFIIPPGWTMQARICGGTITAGKQFTLFLQYMEAVLGEPVPFC